MKAKALALILFLALVRFSQFFTPTLDQCSTTSIQHCLMQHWRSVISLRRFLPRAPKWLHKDWHWLLHIGPGRTGKNWRHSCCRLRNRDRRFLKPHESYQPDLILLGRTVRHPDGMQNRNAHQSGRHKTLLHCWSVWSDRNVLLLHCDWPPQYVQCGLFR